MRIRGPFFCPEYGQEIRLLVQTGDTDIIAGQRALAGKAANACTSLATGHSGLGIAIPKGRPRPGRWSRMVLLALPARRILREYVRRRIDTSA